ncbi:MAG: hypothetical protein ACYDHO_03180 [Gaiellaceae bacterium]
MRRASVAAVVVAVVLGTSVLGAALFASHGGSDVTRSLVYEKAGSGTIWRANLDGSRPVRLAAGTNPQISPDGRFVAFFRNMKTGNAFLRRDIRVPASTHGRGEMFGLIHYGGPDFSNRREYAVYVIPTSGGRAKPIDRLRAEPNLVWAPDSRSIAIGSETALNVIDSRTGLKQRVARRGGAFESHGLSYSASFSPDGRSLVYKLSERGTDDLYVAELKSGVERRITRLGDAGNPVWGSNGIAFSHRHGIWSIGGGGKQLRRLTGRQLADVSVAPLQWAADGERLLLSIAGSGPDRFEVIDAAGSRVLLSGVGYPLGLSRDGRVALIDNCLLPLPPRSRSVMTASLRGGDPRTIVKGACFASWNA